MQDVPKEIREDRVKLEEFAGQEKRPELLNPALANPTTVLYRAGAMAVTDGVSYDYQVTPDADVEAALADGWVKTIAEIGAEPAKRGPGRPPKAE